MPAVPTARVHGASEGATEHTLAARIAPAPVSTRIACGLAAFGCLALLVVAGALRAAPEGLGTHTQLGLPACGWHERYGVPCGTCGMTTSFSHAADGAMLSALAAQPFGALLALGSAVTIWLAGSVAVTGARLGPVVGPVGRGRAVAVLAAAFAAAWLYKIAVA